jgi:ubiquinone biosynthesis protein UbiJ
MDIEHFFKVSLPQLAVHKLQEFLAVDGRLAFSVKGAGKWTVQLGNAQVPVVDGASRDAELKVFCTAAVMQAFLDGTLRPAQAVREGSLWVQGDPRLLEKLGYLMQAQGGPLSTRLSSG